MIARLASGCELDNCKRPSYEGAPNAERQSLYLAMKDSTFVRFASSLQARCYNFSWFFTRVSYRPLRGFVDFPRDCSATPPRNFRTLRKWISNKVLKVLHRASQTSRKFRRFEKGGNVKVLSKAEGFRGDFLQSHITTTFTVY